MLTVARMPPRPNLQHDEPELKQRLDELHLRKIDLADEVFVLDVDGYIGSSTKREIEYAVSKGKPVWYLSGTAPAPTGKPRTIEERASLATDPRDMEWVLEAPDGHAPDAAPVADARELVCQYCSFRDCQCSDFDVAPDMGARG